MDLPVFAHCKHPVDHTAVEVDMGIQCAAAAELPFPHRRQPRYFLRRDGARDMVRQLRVERRRCGNRQSTT
jgi:hypothetical protein